jgi:tRNA-specific 2-thiouridylase
VFYADDGAEGRVLGGGWIDKTIKANAAAQTHASGQSVAGLGR